MREVNGSIAATSMLKSIQQMGKRGMSCLVRHPM